MSIRKLLILVFLLWCLSLIGLILPNATTNIVSLPKGDTKVYHNPTGDRIITIQHRNVILFDINLVKLGQFIDPNFDSRSVTLENFRPIWNTNGIYVVIQNEYYSYYLALDNLNLIYQIDKLIDLQLDSTDLLVNEFYLNPNNQLSYLLGNKLVSYNTETKVINSYSTLEFNYQRIRFVKFHPLGNYVSILYLNNLNQNKLIVYNIENNKTTDIEGYEKGDVYFAPSALYLANIYSDDTNYIIHIMNFEIFSSTQTFTIKKGVGVDLDIIWSQDSDEILRIEDEYGPQFKPERVYPKNIVLYNIISGERKEDLLFKRGLIYESSPISYTWLSKQNKLFLIDFNGEDDAKLIVQDLGDNTKLSIEMADFLFVIFGILSSVLLAIFTIYKLLRGRIDLHKFNHKRNRDSILDHLGRINEDDYIWLMKAGVLTLNIYYFVSSLLNFSIVFQSENNDEPVKYLKFILFSFISFIDLTVILLLFILTIQKYRQDMQRHNIFEFYVLYTSFSILAIIMRYVQGYSFGVLPSKITNWFGGIIFAFLINYIFIMRRLSNPDFAKHRSGRLWGTIFISNTLCLIYSLSYFVSFP